MRHDRRDGAGPRRPTAVRAARTAAACAAAALLVGACGGEAPEQRLEQAAERVRDAREEVRDARRALEAEMNEATRKRAEVADARESLESAQQKLSQASSRLEQRATDVALFRAIQKELLETEDLDDAAVLAHVRDGAVTLYGSAPDAEARERAVQIARETPGVVSVASNVAVTNVERAGAAETNGSAAGASSEADAGS
jgi:osmotically-inducible protein OsmY